MTEPRVFNLGQIIHYTLKGQSHTLVVSGTELSVHDAKRLVCEKFRQTAVAVPLSDTQLDLCLHALGVSELSLRLRS